MLFRFETLWITNGNTSKHIIPYEYLEETIFPHDAL